MQYCINYGYYNMIIPALAWAMLAKLNPGNSRSKRICVVCCWWENLLCRSSVDCLVISIYTVTLTITVTASVTVTVTILITIISVIILYELYDCSCEDLGSWGPWLQAIAILMIQYDNTATTTTTTNNNNNNYNN